MFVLMYGGFETIISNFRPFTGSNMSPVRNLTFTRRSSAFASAVSTASALMSVAVTFTLLQIFAREIPTAPLPQHRSSTSHSLRPLSFSKNESFSRGVLWIVFAASVTSVSVSWRGISTCGFTLNVYPMNSCTPVICCSGIRSALLLISSMYFSSVSGSTSSSALRKRLTLSSPVR